MLRYRENDVLNIPEEYKKMSLSEIRKEEERLLAVIRATTPPPRKNADIERKRSMFRM